MPFCNGKLSAVLLKPDSILGGNLSAMYARSFPMKCHLAFLLGVFGLWVVAQAAPPGPKYEHTWVCSNINTLVNEEHEAVGDVTDYTHGPSEEGPVDTGVQVGEDGLVVIHASPFETWVYDTGGSWANAGGSDPENPFCISLDCKADPRKISLPNVTSEPGEIWIGTLVGKVDNTSDPTSGTWRPVGAEFYDITEEEGTVYLGVWDDSAEGNSGCIFVEIYTFTAFHKVTPPPTDTPPRAAVNRLGKKMYIV